MSEPVRIAGQPKPCCQDEQNLSAPITDSARPGVEIRVCGVCACRHFTLFAEPGVFGLRGAEVR